MYFYSNRDKSRTSKFNLRDAAFLGLAPDGGLFMPEYYPQVDMKRVEELAEISFADMASYLACTIFGDDVNPEEIDAIVRDAFNFEVPLVEIGKGVKVLELFHGPTFAFKDFGGRFMGRMLGLLNKGGDPIIVLTATSGDTGSAVAHGFWKVPGVKVIVLYPKGKVSDFQEAQMTTLGENIFPLAVNGTFDDCQALVKASFNNKDLRSRVKITSANSINILRWIPQSFYYFWGYCQWKRQGGVGDPDIVVPSGNYGNITAGMLAWKMGMPMNRFIAGSNANDIVPAFLESGSYNPKPSVQTVANAMDVGAPSNFERLLYLFDDDYSKIILNVKGYSYSDAEIKDAIKEIYDNCHYLSDPHSAVGYLSYKAADASGFYLSTAHPSKFASVINNSIGFNPELPVEFKKILNLKRTFGQLNNSEEELEKYIEKI